MENTQVCDVPGHAGHGEEQQTFWGGNESMPDHVEVIMPLPPTWHVASALFPTLPLAPVITGSV